MPDICPDSWRTDEACSVTDTGEHCCVLPVGAPNHACPCGATAPLAKVLNADPTIGRASIIVDETGSGRVVVGLTDISSQVGSGTIEFKAGEPTRLKVSLWRVTAAARGEIELDEGTAKALEALGWSGPDTELLRRRDLQEALNIGGVILREWGDLLNQANAVANGYTQAVLQEDATLHKVADALGDNAPSEVKWSRVIEQVGELAARVKGLDK